MHEKLDFYGLILSSILCIRNWVSLKHTNYTNEHKRSRTALYWVLGLFVLSVCVCIFICVVEFVLNLFWIIILGVFSEFVLVSIEFVLSLHWYELSLYWYVLSLCWLCVEFLLSLYWNDLSFSWICNILCWVCVESVLSLFCYVLSLC